MVKSLSSILNNAAYNPGAKPNKYQQNFNEKATKMDVADGFKKFTEHCIELSTFWR